MTYSLMTLHMLISSNLFTSVFNRKSVPGRQGRFCVLMSLFGGMDGARKVSFRMQTCAQYLIAFFEYKV